MSLITLLLAVLPFVGGPLDNEYVLLENSSFLPLKGTESVLFVGPYVDSLLVSNDSLDLSQAKTPWQAMLDRFPNPRNPRLYTFPWRGALMDNKTMSAWIKAAKRADVVVFLGRGTESELELLQNIRLVNRKLVVVLCGPKSLDIPWLRDNCSDIICTWYGGADQGRALVDVLYGDICPSGRLAETTPTYPQGFGRSYTTFRVELQTAPTVMVDLYAQQANPVYAKVTNTGDREGCIVLQLFADYGDELRLVGYERVCLRPLQSQIVTIIPKNSINKTWKSVHLRW